MVLNDTLQPSQIAGHWELNRVIQGNLFGETKFGSDVIESGKWELLGRAQLKYLSSPRFEPGIEYHVDEGTQALGPAVYGRIDLSGSKILWQAGWMFDLDDATADNTIRWQVEWEF